MLKSLLSRLTAPQPQPLSADEGRTALAALLVRVARADGAYDASEIARIEQILTARYGLGAKDATDLRLQAETLEAEAPDMHRFTQAIKAGVPYDERLGVIQALWQVVLADGVREAEEDALLRLLSSLLGVSDRDSALARQSVADKG